MNLFVGVGRLTKDPDVRQSGENKVAKYTLAIDRRGKQEGADFISCVAFGKNAEFVEKYLRKGIKIGVTGTLSTGSYEKNGQKIYTTDVVVRDHEFVESRSEAQTEHKSAPGGIEGFMSLPDAMDEELPFK